MVSQPKAPDPYATANAQTNANLQAAQANAIIGNVNQRNQYGTSTYNLLGYDTAYGTDGKPIYVPRYENVQELSPDEKKIAGLDTQSRYNLGMTGVQQSAKLGQHLQGGIDTSKFQAYNAGPKGLSYDPRAFETQNAEVRNAMMSLYDKDANKQNQAEMASLAARGLDPGGAGYGSAIEGQKSARTDATMKAILAGGQEQSRLLNEQRQNWQTQGTAADRQNALRGQQIQDAIALRNQPINEITALMSGSQVNVPQFQAYNAPQMNAAPIGQYIYDNYNARSQAAAATNKGIFGLAGSLAKIGAGMA